ncbi:MAG: hypothetical protein KatS3mg114_0073 [Planctomycetaceae bacterium]|nr:MAG: hypothetical protein KatS3mg114_0073 [Planctomycetaceae bacterium]
MTGRPRIQQIPWQKLLLLTSLTAAGGMIGVWWWLPAHVPPSSSSSSGTAEGGKSATAKTGSEPACLARPAAPDAGYVGSRACYECHAEICAVFAQHPMARSSARVTEAVPVEDYEHAEFKAPPFSHRDLLLQYRVTREGDQVFHHELLYHTSGELLHEQKVPVHYEIGSGQRGRSYITQREHVMFMSPITWYSQQACWNLSPGYVQANLRFERRIVEGCLVCHTGRIQRYPGRFHSYQEEPFTEIAIGCERCHGPGERHIAWHRGDRREQTDPIVNPVKLAPHLRESVCLQCHLIGANRILRYGRRDDDFRPGMDLNEIWTIFVKGTGVAEDLTTEAVSQAEQMLASRCYQASGGRFGCLSCHDAHQIPQPEEKSTYYRQRCVQCHDEQAGETGCGLTQAQRRQQQADDSCIACHMPRLAANDVPHTSQTDHRVLKRPRVTSSSEDSRHEQTTSRLKPFKFADSPQLSTLEFQRAQAITLMIHAEASSNRVTAQEAIPLLEPWLRCAPDDDLAAEALGLAYYFVREYKPAAAVWETCLKYHPEHDQILRRLVILYHDLEDYEQAIEYGRRYLSINPWNKEIHGRMAHLLGKRGRWSLGIKAAQKAIEIDPGLREVHAWLAEVYTMLGETELAAHHLRFLELTREKRKTP